MPRPREIRVGVIADTHGLLRPEAWEFLLGADHIVHAGDIGDRRILDELQSIAPVSAVRGNNDSGPWASQLADSERLTVGEVCIHVIHILENLTFDPVAAGVQVVISGHSHKPVLCREAGVLFINPGSAGPRRFKLPIAIGELTIQGRHAAARIVDLNDGRPLAQV